ncbi:MAG: (Fe-S)-binding protein, partial [Desulfobacteraceae bacterium]|nr:(Fe-S)-binding protein [Desulfobacteraceae bacterium]
NQKINKCLICGSCASSCPSNVNIVAIFIKARIILTEYSNLSLLKKIIFRGLISKPERFDKVISFFEKFQPFVFKSNQNAQQTSSFRLISSLIKTRNFKKIAKVPFHKTLYAKTIKSEKNKLKVAFFPGCVIDKIYPTIAIDTVKILQYYNVDIYIPENQGCCGIPALAAGDIKTFNELLDHNIDIFSIHDFDYLVTPCATCLSTIKHLWLSFYKNKNKKEKDFLQNLSAKSLDISQFLINILKVPEINENNSFENITYHDPCHHKKVLNIKTEPRTLIRRSGKNLCEMDKADSCCGMGGTFNLLHYKESTMIGRIKAKNIIKTNCSIVATSCPACMMQLADILDKEKTDISIKHPVEIYAEALFDNRK